MKKYYEVVQLQEENSNIAGTSFKRISIGGSDGHCAWSGSAIFDTEQEALDFIEKEAVNNIFDKENTWVFDFSIITRYQVENPNYKTIDQLFPLK